MSAHPDPRDMIGRLTDRCVHFHGIMDLSTGEEVKVCGAGVAYSDVRETAPGGGAVLPCWASNGCKPCPSAKYPTREEAEADHQRSLDRLRARFEAIARGECPDHKVPITLRQVGKCVYGSCGCRLYQGKLPKARA